MSHNPNHDSQQAPQPEDTLEIVNVAAVKLRLAPNRKNRATFYTELGEFMMPEGVVRLYANRHSGSLLFTMPDNSAYTIDSGVAATQCYKYWLLMRAGTIEAEQVNLLPEASVPPIQLSTN